MVNGDTSKITLQPRET